MADGEYKLSAQLISHAMDVRCVSIAKEDCILSGSRDKTAKLWHPEGVKDFVNVVTYHGHRNFVSAVIWMDLCEAYPEGLVMTGSNDMTINGYNLQDGKLLITLKGHENAVVNLSCGRKPGILLSSSWDNTARIWNVNHPDGSAVVLKGHAAAVWAAIELGNGTVATASADKTINLWNKDGTNIRSLTGHKDCVRGLTVASEDAFLSCSNDTTIKLWTNQGECLNTYFGHTNYIYSICTMGQYVVSCGEDSTVRVWQGVDNIRSIALPAQSVWSVACLSNGDIVAGASDGVVRVFTRDETRWAENAMLEKFEEEVKKVQDASSQEIAGFKLSELPGPEVLFEPGKTDGQTKLVRRGTNVKAYSWSAASQSWTEIGDVTGAPPASEGKTLYQGKEYDFVFSVDIEDGAPPLKLPYNRGEDPWQAAQAFIHKNQLPQVYLDQVANFIVKNAKLDELPVSNNGADPFTGKSRYLPGSAAPVARPPVAAADPFTGSGAYVTQETRQSMQEKLLFPHDSYLRFDQANLSAIHEKLKELNQRNGVDSSKLSPEQLEAVVKLGEQNAAFNPEALQVLATMLTWPKDIVFPVLDIARLAVRIKEVNEKLFDSTQGPDFVNFLIGLISGKSSDVSAANQMLALRTLVNAFAHLRGELLVLTERIPIFYSLVAAKGLNKNAQVAAATLLLNMSVALAQQDESEDLAECLAQTIPKLNDNEAQFRALVGLGTLLMGSTNKLAIKAKLVDHKDLYKRLRENADRLPCADASVDKITTCSRQILQLL